MTAGRRDQLVTLQSFTPTQDDYGEEVETWSDITDEWAAVYYGRGSERRQAAAEEGQQAATFQMLSNADTRAVTLKDRIILGGWIWDLVGISPDTPERGLIEFTATATGEQVEAEPSGEPGQFDFSDPANSGLLVLFLEDA